MIHLPAACACAKNIKGHHQAAVNLLFCVQAMGMEALISSFGLFLCDPGSPACVPGHACIGLTTEDSDGNFFPSDS